MILRKQFEQRVKINRARRRAAHQSQSQAAGHLLSTSRDTPFQQTLLPHLSNTNASTLFTLSPLFHPHNPRNPFSTPFLPLPSHPPSHFSILLFARRSFTHQHHLPSPRATMRSHHCYGCGSRIVPSIHCTHRATRTSGDLPPSSLSHIYSSCGLFHIYNIYPFQPIS